MHRFRVEHRDTRDPHFLVFRDKLFVYTGTWYSGPTTLARKDYDLNKHLGYAAWSDDGTTWHSPIMLEGTFGHYIWRAAAFGDKAYLCGRRKTGFAVGPRGEGREVESLMLESDDGLIWRKRAVFQETAGDETAFLFEPDGSVLAIGRRSGPAQLLRSRPPYTQWDRKDLDRYVGGPLVVKWGDHYLVGGRKTTRKAGRRRRSAGWWATGCTSSPNSPAAATTPIPASSNSPPAGRWSPTTPATNATLRASRSRPSTWRNSFWASDSHRTPSSAWQTANPGETCV